MKDFLVTKEGGLRGTDLLNELSMATGLPDELIGEELSRLISTAGKSIESVTLDELRDLLAAYLQDVLLDAKDSFSTEAHDEVQAVAAEIADSSVRNLTSVANPAKTTTFASLIPLGTGARDLIGEG